MEEREIRHITKRRFDAYCYVRGPLLRFAAIEVDWYEAYDRKVLGTIVLDFSDHDYGYVILGRDKRKVFRAIEVSSEFYKTPEEAVDTLRIAFKKYKDDGKPIYEQGDEKKIPNEILVPKVPENKLHKYFRYLINENRFEAARNLINEIVYSYIDVDGNYIKDFQTTGFDRRLWELYLYVYLHNAGFRINNKYQAPDYCLDYFDEKLSIEAVTVNSNPEFDEPGPETALEVHKLSLDYMPIKYGSPLFSKLQKKYWEQEHVKGYPFIIAIHDYHIEASGHALGSMTWSRSALADYLYGYRMKVTIDEENKLINHVIDTGEGIKPVLEEIKEHKWKGKVIPSGFFFLPDAENVSAVLFSNNATITTFNRMGKLAGLGSHDIKMIRMVQLYDPNPYAATPYLKAQDIDEPNYEEGWSDGLIMYHNPKAKYPVNADLFPDISHMFFDIEKKELYGKMQPYDVMASITHVLIPSDTLNNETDLSAKPN